MRRKSPKKNQNQNRNQNQNWLYLAFGAGGTLLLGTIIFVVLSLSNHSFADQATKARQAEARTYVSTLNKLQQAYFTEKDNWGQNINALGIRFNAPTDNYRYSTQIVNSIKTANIKNYPGISVQTGLAKKEGLKSYVGVVYLSNTSSNEVTSLSLLCESNESTNSASGLPKFDGNTMLCPDSYKPL